MNRSEHVNELAAALVKFGTLVPAIRKTADNPFFKSRYAPLDAIIEATAKPLADCGLAVIQLPEGSHLLSTMLVHVSGQFVESTADTCPIKSDPQGIGSAITYARRYGLCSVLGIAPEEDDDAEASMDRTMPKMTVKSAVSAVPFQGSSQPQPECVPEPFPIAPPKLCSCGQPIRGNFETCYRCRMAKK